VRLRATRLAAIAAHAGAPLNPITIWRNGEQAVHLSIEFGMRRNAAVGFDPAQCVLFQDSAATVPVTGTEQPLGYLKDLSGRGNHFWQPSNTASRPIIRLDENSRHYANPDGVDDWLESVNTIDLSGTDAVTLVASMRKDSDAAAAVLFELSTSTSSNSGAIQIRAPQIAATPNFHFASKGTSEAGAAAAGFPAAYKAVLTGIGRISTDTAILRVNGVQVAASSSDQGTGNYGNYKAYLFRRAGTSLPFTGRFYGLTLASRQLAGTELTRLEQWHRNMGRIY